MDFLKKNLVKLLIGAVMLTAAVFALILIINSFEFMGAKGYKELIPTANKSGITGTLLVCIGIFIGALCALIAVIISMLGKDNVSAYILIGAGLLAVILIVVGMIVGAKAVKSMADTIKALKKAGETKSLTYKSTVWNYNTTVFKNIFFLITFGCAPAIFGLKKLFEKSK